MGDKSEHAPDAPMPAPPGRGNPDLAGEPGDIPDRPDGAVLDDDEEDEDGGGLLDEIAEEVRQRIAAGQGRDDAPETGSEGASGKPQTGEW